MEVISQPPPPPKSPSPPPPKWELPVWPPSRVPGPSKSSESETPQAGPSSLPQQSQFAPAAGDPSQYTHPSEKPRTHQVICDPQLNAKNKHYLARKADLWRKHVRKGTKEQREEETSWSFTLIHDYFDLLAVGLKNEKERDKGKGKEKAVEEDVDVDVVMQDVDEGESSTLTPEEVAYLTAERAKETRLLMKSSGKPLIYRYDGEVLEGGEWCWIPREEVKNIPDHDQATGWWIREHADPKDTRTPRDVKWKEESTRPPTQVIKVKYEYDPEASVGPPPPTSVLVTNIAVLTPNATVKQHFSAYGPILSFEPQIDKVNGSPLGVVLIRFAEHGQAKKCVEKEDGRKHPWGGAGYDNWGASGVPAPRNPSGEEIRVILDGDGSRTQAVVRLLDERKRGKKREERDKALGITVPPPNEKSSASSSTPNPEGNTPRPQLPHPSSQTPTPFPPKPVNGRQMHHPLPSRPPHHGSHSHSPSIPGNVTPRNITNDDILNAPFHTTGPPKALPAKPPPPSSNPPAASTGPISVPRPQGKPIHVPEGPKKVPALLMRARQDAKTKTEEATRRMRQQMGGMDVDMDEPEKGREKDNEWEKEKDGKDVRGRGREGRDELLVEPMRRRDSSRDRPRRDNWDREYRNDRRRRTPSRTRARYRSESPPAAYEDDANDQEEDWMTDHAQILSELFANGCDYIHVTPLDGGDVEQWAKRVRRGEAESHPCWRNLEWSKIMKSNKGLFITFKRSANAQRVENVANVLPPSFNNRRVKVKKFKPPTKKDVEAAIRTPQQIREEVILKTQTLIIEELKAQLRRDILDTVVGPEMYKMVQREGEKLRRQGVADVSEARVKGLQGLSFKKKTPKQKVVVVPQEDHDSEQEEEQEEEAQEEERPKKKRKAEVKKVKKRVVEDEMEEADGLESEGNSVNAKKKKRVLAVEVESESEEPKRKKAKVETKKKAPKKSTKKTTTVEDVHDIVLDDVSGFELPSIVRISPGFGSSLSPSRSPSPAGVRLSSPPPTPTPTPPPPVDLGVCDDDEDEYYAKLILSGQISISEPKQPPAPPKPSEEPAEPSTPTVRKHLSGSGRTEGYYKISHAEKMAYVSQYQRSTTDVAVKETAAPEEPAHVVTSSRSNRANARRRAQGLEEINQVQRAVALSKGENVNELNFKFNQLQTRKKHLRFSRSPIHDWGLYAMEKIAKGEMVIEYVGEIIRAQVADKREKTYERQGIGSSYLFRIDEDLVVDATKKGNLGRLINHSCDPNCTAKIITISGDKKIVIYAKQDIELGDEITYDYHFPFEQDKIPCLCGSAKCRGFLN